MPGTAVYYINLIQVFNDDTDQTHIYINIYIYIYIYNPISESVTAIMQKESIFHFGQSHFNQSSPACQSLVKTSPMASKGRATVRFDPVTVIFQIEESDEWTASRVSVEPNVGNAEYKDLTLAHQCRAFTIWWLKEVNLTFIEPRLKDLYEGMKSWYLSMSNQCHRKRSYSDSQQLS